MQENSTNLKQRSKRRKMKTKDIFDTIFKLSAIIALLVVSFSVVWFFVISPYQNRKKIDICLEDVREKHKETWIEYCHIDGKEIGEDGSCLLASERTDVLKEFHEKRRIECFKKYPVK